MVIIIDKRISNRERFNDDTLVEINLDNIHITEDVVEDKMLEVYKEVVEHEADMVILADKDITDSLFDEGVLVCYTEIKEEDE